MRAIETHRSFAAVTAAFLVAAPSVAAAKAIGSNSVEAIEMRALGPEREVVIHTTKAPTFSVFRLADPFRVLVDVNDAKLARSMDLLRYDGDGVMRFISTQAFADESSAVVRVEIALEGARPYDVRADGTTVLVRIAADPGAEKASAEKPAQAAPAAEPPSTEPAIAPAAPVRAAPRGEGYKIGKLSKRAKGKTLFLSASLEGAAPAPDAVAIEHVDDPSRMVIDLAGASAEPKYQTLNVGQRGVKRARVATGDLGVRIVLDLEDAKSLPEVKVDAVGGKLQVSVGPAPKIEAQPAVVANVEKPSPESVLAAPAAEPAPAPAKPAATQVAPAVEAKPAEAAPAPSKAAVAVSDVRFEPKDGFVRFSLELSGDAEVVKDPTSTQKTPVLRISGAKLPESLVRTLDTSAVAGRTVSAISTYNDGGDTLVVASVSGETEHRNWRKGNKVIWDFRQTPAPAPAAAEVEAPAEPAPVSVASSSAKVIPYGEQATSGFTSEALSTASLLTTERQRYTGRRISLDLKDADIRNVLRLLADVSKLNIVAADDVNGKITLKLRNVPWDQALDIILRAKQLDKTRNGNIIRIAPIDVLEKEEQIRLQRREASEKLEPLSVRLIPVSYAVATAVSPQVKALLSPRGKVNIDERTNVLVVEDIAEVLLKIERLVRTLDTQTPQVLIEARIVEAGTSFTRDLGIQWGGTVNMSPVFGTQTGLAFPNTIRISGGADDGNTPTAGVRANDNGFAVNLPVGAGTGSGGSLGFIFGSAGGSALLSLRLTAAETQGKTKIISSPKIVTLDNKKAKILSGEKIPITVLTANGPSTRFVDANLELGVTPHVTSDGSILMQIDAKKNELSQRQDLLGTPGILTREASTEMLVRDGDTAVLGGIYRRTASESKNYVPWLGSIPVLGWLFKNTRRSDAREELLIFISPRIVNRSRALVTGR